MLKRLIVAILIVAAVCTITAAVMAFDALYTQGHNLKRDVFYLKLLSGPDQIAGLSKEVKDIGAATSVLAKTCTVIAGGTGAWRAQHQQDIEELRIQITALKEQITELQKQKVKQKAVCQ